MAGSLIRKLWNFEKPRAALRAIRALAVSKILFLRKFEKSYTCQNFFFSPNEKIRVYLLLIMNREKLSGSYLRHRLSI